MSPLSQLRKQAFSDVIVAAPIRGPLGKRELIHEVTVLLAGDPGRHHGDLIMRFDQMNLRPGARNGLALCRGGSAREPLQ